MFPLAEITMHELSCTENRVDNTIKKLHFSKEHKCKIHLFYIMKIIKKKKKKKKITQYQFFSFHSI